VPRLRVGIPASEVNGLFTSVSYLGGSFFSSHGVSDYIRTGVSDDFKIDFD